MDEDATQLEQPDASQQPDSLEPTESQVDQTQLEQPADDDDQTLLSQPSVMDSTQLEEPATQIEEPATQIEEPATQIEEPATQIEEPATQVEEPPTQATQLEEPTLVESSESSTTKTNNELLASSDDDDEDEQNAAVQVNDAQDAESDEEQLSDEDVVEPKIEPKAEMVDDDAHDDGDDSDSDSDEDMVPTRRRNIKKKPRNKFADIMFDDEAEDVDGNDDEEEEGSDDDQDLEGLIADEDEVQRELQQEEQNDSDLAEYHSELEDEELELVGVKSKKSRGAASEDDDDDDDYEGSLKKRLKKKRRTFNVFDNDADGSVAGSVAGDDWLVNDVPDNDQDEVSPESRETYSRATDLFGEGFGAFMNASSAFSGSGAAPSQADAQFDDERDEQDAEMADAQGDEGQELSRAEKQRLKEKRAEDRLRRTMDVHTFAEGFYTQKDQKIRTAGWPERVFERAQIWEADDALEDEDALKDYIDDEARFIFEKAFTLRAVEHRFPSWTKARQEFQQLIRSVLRFFHVDKFDVPFIWHQRRDSLRQAKIVLSPDGESAERVDFSGELTLCDLWTIWDFDLRWTRLDSRKKYLLRVVEQKTDQAGLPEGLADDILVADDEDHLDDYARLLEAVGGGSSNGDATTKNPAKVSLFRQAALHSLGDFVAGLGDPDLVAKNVDETKIVHYVVDPPQTVDEVAQETQAKASARFDSGEHVQAAVVKLMARQLALDPRLRQWTRRKYLDRRGGAMISTVPTKKGQREINWLHSCIPVKRLSNKPARSFDEPLRTKKRVSPDYRKIRNSFCPDEGFGSSDPQRVFYQQESGGEHDSYRSDDRPLKRDEPNLQGLLLDKAEQDGLINVEIHFDNKARSDPDNEMVTDPIVIGLYNLWVHSEQGSETDWDIMRLKICEAASELLKPIAEKWLRARLTQNAQHRLKVACMNSLSKRYANLAVPEWRNPPNLDDDAILAASNGEPRPARLMACVVGDFDHPSFCAVLNEYGELVDHQMLHFFKDEIDPKRMTRASFTEKKGFTAQLTKKAADVAKFRRFWELHRPKLICVDAAGAHCLSFARGITTALREWDGHFGIHMAAPDVSLVSRNIRRVKQEMKGFGEQLRQATCLGRFVLAPLTEVCNLWHVDADTQHNAITALDLHPLQGYLPKEMLSEGLEKTLVNCVARHCVDINAVLNRPHLTSPLQFVAGLGPRKSKAFLERAAKQSHGFITCRQAPDETVAASGSLRSLLNSSEDFNNAACFLFVRESSELGQSQARELRHVLDDTRIHPDEYDLATAVVENSIPTSIMPSVGVPAEPLQGQDPEPKADNWLERALEVFRTGRIFDEDLVYDDDLTSSAGVQVASIHGYHAAELKATNAEHRRRFEEKPENKHKDFHEAVYDGCLGLDYLNFAHAFGHGKVSNLFMVSCELDSPGAMPPKRFPRHALIHDQNPPQRETFEERKARERDPSTRQKKGAAWEEQLELEKRIFPEPAWLESLCNKDEWVCHVGPAAGKTERIGQLVNARVLWTSNNDVVVALESGRKGYIMLDLLHDNATQVMRENSFHPRQQQGDSESSGADARERRQAWLTGIVTKGLNVKARIIGFKENSLMGDVWLTCRNSDIRDQFDLRHNHKLEHGHVFEAIDFEDEYLNLNHPDDSEINILQKEFSSRKQRKFQPRNIDFPKFKNVDREAAEKFLETQEIGDCVLRPSSKGNHNLTLTWKLAEDPDICVHFDIQEKDKPNAMGVGRRLVIEKESFEDLDEVVARFVERLTGLVRMMVDFKYFRYGTEDEVDTLLVDEKQENSNKVHYAISFSYKHEGRFRLSCLGTGPIEPNHDDETAKIKQEFVSISMSGFRFRKRCFKTPEHLIGWWKRHFNDKKQAAAPVAPQAPIDTYAHNAPVHMDLGSVPYTDDITPSLSSHQRIDTPSTHTPLVVQPQHQYSQQYSPPQQYSSQQAHHQQQQHHHHHQPPPQQAAAASAYPQAYATSYSQQPPAMPVPPQQPHYQHHQPPPHQNGTWHSAPPPHGAGQPAQFAHPSNQQPPQQQQQWAPAMHAPPPQNNNTSPGQPQPAQRTRRSRFGERR